MLFSKPRCGLCDKARAVLRSSGIAFEEVDITHDPGLKEEYGLLIPVVEVGGKVVFDAGMTAAELPQLIEESQRG